MSLAKSLQMLQISHAQTLDYVYSDPTPCIIFLYHAVFHQPTSETSLATPQDLQVFVTIDAQLSSLA